MTNYNLILITESSGKGCDIFPNPFDIAHYGNLGKMSNAFHEILTFISHGKKNVLSTISI